MNVVKFQRDSTLQRIKASYIDDGFELSPQEQEIKKRLIHYHSLIFDKKYSKHQAVKIHQREMKKADGKSISMATAYRDAQQVEYVFGSIQKTDVEFQRVMLMENYFNLYQMNLQKRELESAKSALDSYSKLINWNVEESKVNLEKLESSEIHLKLDRASAKILKEQFSGGVVDFNNLDVEDIDFKEVDDDKEDA